MAAAAKGLKAGNKLLYSEDHFQGYWVQLQTLVRKDDRADELLDGIIENPLQTIADAVYNGDPDDEVDAKLMRIAELVKTLYESKRRVGHPPGTFPPSIQNFNYNPLLHIKDFAIATNKGTKGGTGPVRRHNTESRAWVKKAYALLIDYKAAVKHIWETSVATLPSSMATTIISNVPYGNGVVLLRQIKGQQQRQTTMALFMLFSQLITIKLLPGKGLKDLYGRPDVSDTREIAKLEAADCATRQSNHRVHTTVASTKIPQYKNYNYDDKRN